MHGRDPVYAAAMRRLNMWEVRKRFGDLWPDPAAGPINL